MTALLVYIDPKENTIMLNCLYLASLQGVIYIGVFILIAELATVIAICDPA